MKTLRFEGYSDDTFSCTGKGIDVDRDNAADMSPVSMRVAGSGGELLVTGQYCPSPATGWQVSVAPSHDDPDENPIPEWPMRVVRGERPYSAALEIDAPDDVTVELVEDDD